MAGDLVQTISIILRQKRRAVHSSLSTVNKGN
jgi:hypothetical protein